MQPQGRERGTPEIVSVNIRGNGREHHRTAQATGGTGAIRTIGLDIERATWHNARSFQGVCVSR